MADELDAIFDAVHSGGGSPGGDELDLIFDSVHRNQAPQSSLPTRTLKQFGAGAVKGITGLAALMGDLQPNELMRAAIAGEGIAPFRYSRGFDEATDRVLPAPEDKEMLTRYARTIGEFVGPTALTGGVGMAARGIYGAGEAVAPPAINWMASQIAPRAIGSAATGAVGAQAAEDLTGNSTIAPFVGGILGSAAPSVLSNTARGLWSVLRPASQAELKGSAALAQHNITGLNADDIASAIADRPADDLGRLMTTAELTDNAGMAQIEKTLAAKDAPARLYNDRVMARADTRDEMINAMSRVGGVNKEALGSGLIQKGTQVSSAMDEGAKALWDAVPRKVPINIGAQQNEISAILGARQAGLAPGSKVSNLIEQFMTKDKRLNSGALQDIRSDALMLLRDQNLSPFETRLLASLQSNIDNAMETGLPKNAYGAWRAARDATALRAETFAPGTAGGSLVHPSARPANVLRNAFKGDSESVKELQRAVAADPALMENIKRGILDMIPRSEQGITAAKMKQFLAANEGGFRALFGEKHYGALNRIMDDLRSQANVSRMAFRASEGNSVTAQRQTVAGALLDEVAGSLIPENRLLGRMAMRMQGAAATENKNAINALLFRAALEPEFALELAQTPTTKRVLSAIERLKQLGSSAAEAGAKGAVLDVATEREERGLERRQAPGLVLSLRRSSSQSAEQPQPESQGLIAPAPQEQGQRQDSGTETMQGIRTPQTRSPLQRMSAVYPPSPDSAPVQDETQAVFNALLAAVKHVESRGNPNAVSSKGAVGTHQVTPPAMRDILRAQGVDDRQYTDAQLREIAKRPGMSEQFGAAYLQMLLKKYKGDITTALTAYHSGMGNVERGTIGPEGRAYAPAVEAVFQRLLQEV